MSPSGDVVQTPDAKAAGGLASVFKSLTGTKPSRSPISPSVVSPATNVHLAQQLNAAHTGNAAYGGPPNYEQLYAQLKAGGPLAERLAAAESLRYAIADYPLIQVTNVWYAAKDLISPLNPADVRHAGFELLTACVQHSSSTDLERREYFDTITAQLAHEDFHLQLVALVELTRHGKDLSGFHYEIVPLLTRWLRTIFGGTLKARKEAHRLGRGRAPLGEETNLNQLFDFLVKIIKFSFNVSTEDDTAALIDAVVSICEKAPITADILACIGILDAIVTYSVIPVAKLWDCVKLLCSIHSVVTKAQDKAWKTISNLCKSHNGQTTVRLLLGILQLPPSDAKLKEHVREIRGSISVLEKLMRKDGEKGYPVVPFTLLMGGLAEVSDVEQTKIELDVLHLIISLFDGDSARPKDNVIEEDWTLMFVIAIKCAGRALEVPTGRPAEDRSRSVGPAELIKTSKSDELSKFINDLSQSLFTLISRIEKLLATQPEDFTQRENCIKFLSAVHSFLSEQCAKTVVEYYIDLRLCYPSDPGWKSNIQLLLEAFFADSSWSNDIRLLALRAVTEVYEMIDMMDDETVHAKDWPYKIMGHIAAEKDISVLTELVSQAVIIADTADERLFGHIIGQFHDSLTHGHRQSSTSRLSLASLGLSRMSSDSPSSSTATGPSITNVVTKGLIQIFMRSLDTSTYKALRVFEELLLVLKSSTWPTDARVSALKLVFRLRADWAHRIFLTPFTESDLLAALLYRTSPSLALKEAADELSQQNQSSRSDDSGTPRPARGMKLGIRSPSGINRTVQKNHQLWMSPDPEALPDFAADKASGLLYSFLEPLPIPAGRENPRKVLPIDACLELIISLLRGGCDWEVYSYILVHLPSQLSNRALFSGAVAQVKTLRQLLCEQIIKSNFQEPPSSAGLRRAEIAICILHSVTMLISYHEHFQKMEEDEIVRTFVHGISAWEGSAKKICVHALSICSHELPASLSRSLTVILQKMSQFITQSHVAVHILEFLACLSRLPDLYVNFREDDYRTVFGICFRYLQYVRDKPFKASNQRDSQHSQHSGRNVPLLSQSAVEGTPHPGFAEDLPQYVYALAYHVITFWFLSLRLSDRAIHVSWIIKNLVSTDIYGKERIDEQAQVTIDFMQRVTYANVDDSVADPDFSAENYGEIMKKRWLVGPSIVTIEQPTRGGWAQITRRQPSGTSCYMIKERYRPPPAHQSLYVNDALRDTKHSDGGNIVLPSHLLFQLCSPYIPSEISRPIPLPDDDMIRRAISIFDRISTLDGHKVGVIYIGEKQTEESEILANVMGSSDYIDFLAGLGTLTKLKGATFNTQGLDREYNTDGDYTFCWRDRVTEIVFHVTTQMPTNLEHDPRCVAKKRHIGNDFVNIIFNNSGLPFRFDTFASDFNFVNIVITPESRASFVATRVRGRTHEDTAFYKVQVMSKPGFPEISPAAETKVVSLKALPDFIRLLALNASVFSLVWANREGGEHVSSWRSRLREIIRLREKYNGNKTSTLNTASTTSPPSTASGGSVSGIQESTARAAREGGLGGMRRTSVVTFLTNSDYTLSSQRSSILSTAETEVGYSDAGLAEQLDFSKCA